MPNVSGAVALNLTTIRVTFSAPLADATALDLSKWTLLCLSVGPFFVPTIESIVGVDSQVTPSQIDITTTSEFSPGLLYSATCVGVTGVTSPHNVAAFYAQIPTTFADRDFDLIDVVPAVNKQEDTTGQLVSFIASLQEPLTLLLNDVDRFADILDPDLAPSDFVDAMLFDLGNPFTFIPDLSLSQRRKLVKLLIPIYQLKGTVPGVVEAIRLLMGWQSQFPKFDGVGLILGVDYLGDGTHTGTWFLGGGGPFQFTAKIATTPTGNGIGANSYGRALSASERAILIQILGVMKPCGHLLRQLTPGLPAAPRATIHDDGAGVVTIKCLGITNATTVVLWERSLPGVNEYNSLSVATTAGVKAAYTPGSTKYWTGSGTDAITTGEGLYSNEVTNALAAPVLTATPGTGKITLTWPAVTGATSYRIYKSLAAAVNPGAADNAATPIQIYADLNSYVDSVNTGDHFYYIITPVTDNSEGFYSNEANATAL